MSAVKSLTWNSVHMMDIEAQLCWREQSADTHILKVLVNSAPVALEVRENIHEVCFASHKK